MSFLKDLMGFISTHKKYWLIPPLFIMTLFGALIILTKGSAIAPFIYTVF
jgi:hypothetical protein